MKKSVKLDAEMYNGTIINFVYVLRIRKNSGTQTTNVFTSLENARDYVTILVSDSKTEILSERKGEYELVLVEGSDIKSYSINRQVLM